VVHLLGAGQSPYNFSTENIDLDYKKNYRTVKFTGESLHTYQKSVASVKLTEYFDQCFKDNNLELKEDAKTNLIDVFGEIIGNAEEHCGIANGMWHVLGCYNKEKHECGFSIINFGKTIYDNLSDKSSTSAVIIRKINKIMDSQRPFLKQIYGLFSDQYEEPIWNIMALQDGISSKRTESGPGSTRGQGIMDVLDFIEVVKAPKNGAKIAIVSGNSTILIDYKYPIIHKEIGDSKENRRMIAFNKYNDLHQLPDQNKVFLIDHKFEGTIFSGKFVINEKYLVKRLRK